MEMPAVDWRILCEAITSESVIGSVHVRMSNAYLIDRCAIV